MSFLSIFIDLLLVNGMIYVIFLQFFTLLSVLLHYKNVEFKDFAHKIYSQNSMVALLLAVPFLQYAIVHRLIVRTKEFGNLYMALRIGLYFTLMVLSSIEPLFAPLLIFYVNFLLIGFLGLEIYLNIGSLRSSVIKHFFNDDEVFEKEFLAFFFGNTLKSLIASLKAMGTSGAVSGALAWQINQDYTAAREEARENFEKADPSKLTDEKAVADARDSIIENNGEIFPIGWVYHKGKMATNGIRESVFPKASPEAIKAAKKIMEAAADQA